MCLLWYPNIPAITILAKNVEKNTTRIILYFCSKIDTSVAMLYKNIFYPRHKIMC